MCLAFPGVTERPSHGEAAWFVADKHLFVTMSDHHHDDRFAFWAAAAQGAQEMLVANQPDVYFRPPYVGHRGWLGMWLDTPVVDWHDVAVRVREAYGVIAGA
ncbi:MAG TPA: MmcQ/YjbR family DNA-binding protein [Candidatus Limnocylindrales bacterium]